MKHCNLYERSFLLLLIILLYSVIPAKVEILVSTRMKKLFRIFASEAKQKVEKVYRDSRSGNSSLFNIIWSHEYFSAEKSPDPDSHRRAPSLKLGPIPISTRLRGNDICKKISCKPNLFYA
jgi:hypothetical protein